MGACETTPPATYREHAHDPDRPTAQESFLALEDLPPLAGVQLVRPRRCATAGAPSSTPGRAARRPGQLRGRIQKNSQPSPAARVVTRSGSFALLTLVALMGAAMRYVAIGGAGTSESGRANLLALVRPWRMTSLRGTEAPSGLSRRPRYRGGGWRRRRRPLPDSYYPPLVAQG